MLSPDTPLLIQGITGQEGSRMAGWLLACGTRVVCGVTPGKGGQAIESLPVFNSVSEARTAFPACTTSSIVVPAPRVLGAFREAVEAGMTFIHILTEQTPVHDVLEMTTLARTRGVRLLGPSSIGYLQFPKFRLGYLGGEHPFEAVREGSAAVISVSGGMTNELMTALSREGIGTAFAIALGGDRVVGTTIEDAVRMAEEEDAVRLITLFIEPGRALLREIAAGSFTFKKPAVILLPGDALAALPRGVPYGHTGTVLGDEDADIEATRAAIRARGIPCVGTVSAFVEACGCPLRN